MNQRPRLAENGIPYSSCSPDEGATEPAVEIAEGTTKLVWIASMPRSGSMWTYNVTRSVLRHCRKKVLPEEVPQAHKDVLAHAAQGLNDQNAENIWALKVHGVIRQDVPRSRFITTHRDPRDALVSFKRFMRCDFDRALEGMKQSILVCDYYRNFPEQLCLQLQYSDILENPQDVIQRIAEHIGFPVSPDAALQIAQEFSKEKVKKRIEDAEQRVQRRVASGDSINRNEIVMLGPQMHRVMDLPTGFQTGHVSDYKDGDWRDCLSVAEKEKVQAALGPWLDTNGYPETFAAA